MLRNSISSKNMEDMIVYFLAIIYSNISWRKIKTNKNAHDVFNHRVRAASRRGTLYEFASRLCNYFGMQSIPFEAQELLELLRPYEREVLNLLQREHIPYCVRAIIKAKEIKKEKKGGIEE